MKKQNPQEGSVLLELMIGIPVFVVCLLLLIQTHQSFTLERKQALLLRNIALGHPDFSTAGLEDWSRQKTVLKTEVDTQKTAAQNLQTPWARDRFLHPFHQALNQALDTQSTVVTCHLQLDSHLWLESILKTHQTQLTVNGRNSLTERLDQFLDHTVKRLRHFLPF